MSPTNTPGMTGYGDDFAGILDCVIMDLRIGPLLANLGRRRQNERDVITFLMEIVARNRTQTVSPEQTNFGPSECV